MCMLMHFLPVLLVSKALLHTKHLTHARAHNWIFAAERQQQRNASLNASAVARASSTYIRMVRLFNTFASHTLSVYYYMFYIVL